MPALFPIVLAVVCAPSLAQPSLRDEIQSTLSEMAAAAVRGDAETYMSYIATDEPEFLNEQKAWARDILRIAPDLLRYEVLTDPETSADGAEATADIRITWNSPNWDGGDRSIELPARFVRDTEGEDAGTWDYAGRDWLERDAEGLRVLHAEGAGFLAREAAGFWPEVKAHVEEGFETSLDHAQVVKMYPGMMELQFSIFPAYAEPLGGWNEPGESIKLIGRETGPDHLKSVLAHEYGHALTFAMGGPDLEIAVKHAHAMPWWLMEGTAEVAAAKFGKNYARVKSSVNQWYKADEMPAWEDITNFYETDPENYRYVYAQGMHFVAYTSARFGRTKRNAWLRTMMEGASLEDATTQVFEITFDELDAVWRASIEAELAL